MSVSTVSSSPSPSNSNSSTHAEQTAADAARRAAEAARKAAEAARKAAEAAQERARAAQKAAADAAQKNQQAKAHLDKLQKGIAAQPQHGARLAPELAAAQKKVATTQARSTAASARVAPLVDQATGAANTALQKEQVANQTAKVAGKKEPFAGVDNATDAFEARTFSAKDQQRLFGTTLAIPNHLGDAVDSQFQLGLGRNATAKERTHYESLMLSVLHAPGKNIFDAVGALDTTLMGTRDFQTRNPNFAATSASYQSQLERAPTIAEVNKAEQITQLVEKNGGTAAQAQALIVGSMKDRKLDLESPRFQQPDGSTCAPSSVVNAMLAFGLPADLGKALALTGETVGSGGGFGGNASLLADRINGANLGFVADQRFMEPSQQNAATLAAQLKRGTAAIVNGTVIGGNSGHFVCVKGLDAQGNFVMGDPWGKEQDPITAQNGGNPHWTPAQMDAFMHGGANPPGFITLVRS